MRLVQLDAADATTINAGFVRNRANDITHLYAVATTNGQEYALLDSIGNEFQGRGSVARGYCSSQWCTREHWALRTHCRRLTLGAFIQAQGSGRNFNGIMRIEQRSQQRKLAGRSTAVRERGTQGRAQRARAALDGIFTHSWGPRLRRASG